MTNNLYKAITLDSFSVAFFGNHFDHFFIYKVADLEFVRINVILYCPLPRENFVCHKLPDGRILFFGGGNKEKCYNDAFYLMEYIIEENIQFGWNSIDTFGAREEGYYGHASLLLPNDNLLIHGGTKRAYDNINTKENQWDPLFTNRFKIVDITKSYKYEKLLNSKL